jgi:rare lipoprotein A
MGVIAMVLLPASAARLGVPPPAVTAPGPGRSECGVASWYRTTLGAAHRTLRLGTTVTVTNSANDRSVTVVINDRGPFIPGRTVNLSDRAFAAIAPLGQGLARVCLRW